MMIPKIDFRYSHVYDEIYRNSLEIRDFLRRTNQKYPHEDELKEFRDKMEKIWKKEGRKVISKINEIGLKWPQGKIVCYVVGACRPMSDPLTIRMCNDMNYAIDMLTHELIHQAQIKIADEKWGKWQKYLDAKYPYATPSTKGHILLTAIHRKIYLELFGGKRLAREVSDAKVVSDYKTAWQIVEDEGHNKIIKKFKQFAR